MNTKKTIVVFLLCMATLFACEKKEPVVNQADADCPKFFNAPVPPKEKGSNKSVPVSVREAAEKIEDLLKHWPLEGMARRLALGGHFYASPFKIASTDTAAAVILWNCYNPNREFGYPVLFVAVEQVAKFDPNNPPSGPAASTLDAPINPVVYDEDANDVASAQKFIRNKIRLASPAPPEKTISKELVEEYIKNFNLMMTTLEALGENEYNAHPFAVFGNNKHYVDFEGRQHKFVKYCFTLYWDEKHQPNFFRPVLGLADDNGVLVETTNDAGEDGSMLQKSWPPPPNQ